jgi:hypothetical protein
MTVLCGEGVVAARVSTLTLRARAAAPDGDGRRDTVPARCNCTHPHTDRPDGQSGCGKWGVIPAP